MRHFIPLAKPALVDKDIEAVAEVLRSGMLVQGRYVEQLEAGFAEMHQVPHAIAVSSGTAALHLALKVAGVGPGDEVIVPAFSFTATANAIELVGGTPVFADIELSTFNIDTTRLDPLFARRTKAILPVHEFGLACDLVNISALSKKYGVAVIEDAACALGASQGNNKAGAVGLLSIFSLHPRKSITSGEGGIILTHDAGLSVEIRRLRNHGMEPVAGGFDFVQAGFNYRLTDFQAALALSQLGRLPDILERKSKIASAYLSRINNPRVTLPFTPVGFRHTWQTFHVLLDDSLDQSKLIAALKEKGIGTNLGAYCIPQTSYYQSKYRIDTATRFPNALRAQQKGLAIPIYESMTDQDVDVVVNAMNAL